MMKLLVPLFLTTLALTPTYPLQCYTCEKTKTITDRFTKEETVSIQCTDDPADWTVQTCSDKREFCSYENIKQDYFQDDYRRGCAIPANSFFLYTVMDSLDSGGNSICWHSFTDRIYNEYRSRYGYKSAGGQFSCFCNTDLCNTHNVGIRQGSSFSAVIILVMFILCKYI
eukprot:TRINITY_DN48153_c0_g1_i1.p1 TRINITY_DN48153_c0_g1~~TRINITY_DN48153_c0_g1_i1.p1  ORF type:complete len:170 (-),score=13.91 TRINITY_DN48153_c0_g1_i1:19-528(-)